jgi:putative two-component system response regulator
MNEQDLIRKVQVAEAAIAERDMVLWAAASLIDTNGNPRSIALRRKQALLAALIRQLQKSPEYAGKLSATEAELIVRASPLQDIGKSGVPDRITLKPGRLDEEELELMRTHTTIGFEALKGAERLLGRQTPFLKYAQEIAYCHQEKWDGSGYPRKLEGEAIPLAARLASIIDVYNAIISRRVYKPALPHEKAVEIIRDGRGRDFDPVITDAFLAIAGEIRTLAQKYADQYDEQAEIRRLASAAAEEIELS